MTNLTTPWEQPGCQLTKLQELSQPRNVWQTIATQITDLRLKEVCNRGVACSLLKLGSLEKTVTASLFHSGLHSSSPFFVEKTTLQELLPS